MTSFPLQHAIVYGAQVISGKYLYNSWNYV
jgi:hypothetical protein